MLERKGPSAWIRDAQGSLVEYPFSLMKHESVLSQIIEPHLYPEISAVRQQILRWRFYHHFRTDVSSPLRQPQVGVQTPVLSHDGSDLAAALQTVIEIGDNATLEETIGGRVQRRSAADREHRNAVFHAIGDTRTFAPALCPRVFRWATAIPLPLRGFAEQSEAAHAARAE